MNGRKGPQQGPASCGLMWSEPTVPDSRYMPQQHSYPNPNHEGKVAKESPPKWRSHVGGKVTLCMLVLPSACLGCEQSI